MRILIVTDGAQWFVRRVATATHDLDADEMVYRCDKPLGPAFDTLDDAVAYVEGRKLHRTAQAQSGENDPNSYE